MKNLGKRIPAYLLGLFVMTLGIASAVKSNLGTAPVSSVPYMMTLVFGIEMGKATIIFQSFLVLVQLALLRKKFKPISFAQVIAGIIFGYFTTFCNWCFSFLPSTDNIVLRILMIFAAVVLIAVGIFLYVPADIMPLASEGTIQAISQISGVSFSKIKVFFDITLVVISGAMCLIFTRSLGAVGIGTVITAVSVGIVHGFITKLFGTKRDKWLKGDTTEDKI